MPSSASLAGLVFWGSAWLVAGCSATPAGPSPTLSPSPPAPIPTASEVAAVLPPASASAPTPRRVELAFRDERVGPKAHTVFVVSPELGLHQAVASYDDPGACIFNPSPSRERPRQRHERAGGGGSSPARSPLPAGAWMRCGASKSLSEGVALVPEGLLLNDDVIAIPEGVTLALPSSAPDPAGTRPCPADATARPVNVTFSVTREDRSRTVLMRIPELALELAAAQLPEAGNCTSVVSERGVWLLHACRSGERWQRHSEDNLLLRVSRDRLLVRKTSHSIDLGGAEAGAILLPCGARVRFQGKTVTPSRSAPAGCVGACRLPEGTCEDRCLAKHGDDDGHLSTEAAVTCQGACREKAGNCEARCFGAAGKVK